MGFSWPEGCVVGGGEEEKEKKGEWGGDQRGGWEWNERRGSERNFTRGRRRRGEESGLGRRGEGMGGGMTGCTELLEHEHAGFHLEGWGGGGGGWGEVCVSM